MRPWRPLKKSSDLSPFPPTLGCSERVFRALWSGGGNGFLFTIILALEGRPGVKGLAKGRCAPSPESPTWGVSQAGFQAPFTFWGDIEWSPPLATVTGSLGQSRVG